jgi:hypothetical protein
VTKREAFATSMAVLAASFNRELPGPAIEGYWLALQDLSEAELAAATKRALAECRFMPAPVELLALAGRARSLVADTAQAWEAVRTAMDRHDYTASVDFGPLVNAVVRNIGGWDALCRASLPDLVWRRKDFERVYEAFASKPADQLNGEYHRGALKGPPVRIAIGGKLPPKQIEAATDVVALNARGVVRALADAKS